jgi:hypothetical protein
MHECSIGVWYEAKLLIFIIFSLIKFNLYFFRKVHPGIADRYQSINIQQVIIQSIARFIFY